MKLQILILLLLISQFYGCTTKPIKQEIKVKDKKDSSQSFPSKKTYVEYHCKKGILSHKQVKGKLRELGCKKTVIVKGNGEKITFENKIELGPDGDGQHNYQYEERFVGDSFVILNIFAYESLGGYVVSLKDGKKFGVNVDAKAYISPDKKFFYVEGEAGDSGYNNHTCEQAKSCFSIAGYPTV